MTLVRCNCPHCSMGYELPSTVLGKPTRCTKCGEKFELKEYVPPAPPPKPAKAASADRRATTNSTISESANGPPPVPPPPPNLNQSAFGPLALSITPSVSSGRARSQFLPLRYICRILEFLAALAAGLIVLTVVVAFVNFAQFDDSTASSLLELILATALFLFVGSIVVALLLLAPQLIRLLLRIEDNTYEASESAYRLNATLAYMNGVWQRNQQESRKKREEVSDELEFD